MSEELAGPKKSKEAINMLEEWLIENCKEPMRIADIEANWQYITGHEPRKTRQYLKAIETSGRIKIYSNSGDKMCVLSGFTTTSKEQEQSKHTTSKLGDIIEKHILREKMLAGPCYHKCTVPPSLDCRTCSAFRDLKNKDWLEKES